MRRDPPERRYCARGPARSLTPASCPNARSCAVTTQARSSAMLDLILAQAVNGLVLGFLYVLIAVGLSIIFGMLGVVNFAHGAFFAIGAYLALVLNREFGWGGGAAGAPHRRRARDGRRTGAGPASLRQGAAAQPHPYVRARPADRGDPADDVRRRAARLLDAALSVRLSRSARSSSPNTAWSCWS
jgi:hypothetical protein